MMKTFFSWLKILSFCVLVWTGAAQAANVEGFQIEDRIRLADTELQLNGVGVRSAYFLKFYVASMYLTQRSSSKDVIVRTTGPKRFQMAMLFSASSADFNKALTKGMRRNSTDEEFAKLEERMHTMEKIIDSFVTVKRGDVINMDFIPGKGTVVSVNGLAKFSPIGGEDFYGKLLEVFIGEHVSDEPLRQRLLGL